MAMNVFKLRTVVAFAAVAALGLGTATTAFADKPSWAGNGNGNGKSHKADKDKNDKYDRDDDRREWHDKHGKHFHDHDRVVVHNYYEREYHKGKGCPPGLAKKHNGCMPPGQAKKWRYGHPLPRDVVWYPVPHELVIQLPAPPSGYKYVRVASDILMIAAGSSMVVDAIQDLGAI
jgi:Ni/Co efflux regulator RcnB